MDLRDRLMDDLKEAMRQRDERRKTTIRSVIAAIKKEETELDSSGERVSLDDVVLYARVISIFLLRWCGVTG